ncbi:MAG: hypothetical protein SOH70_03975 [Lentilactobacillus sunkii]|jgi:hypothetical protein|uniref:hypothetical protein n=1 Tax=Lentilactobacillus sunkii TaxID=481719 RepID=UPI002F35988C
MKVELSHEELQAISDGFDTFFSDRVSDFDPDYRFQNELNQKLKYLAKESKNEQRN